MKRFLLGILLAALPSLAYAEDHPSLEKGFAPEKVYQFGDLDHVNIFNGNLIVSLSVGPRFTLNGGMTYGLSLTYNSKIWRIRSGSVPPPPDAFDELPRTVWHTEIHRHYNCGLGWQLGMGRLYDPF